MHALAITELGVVTKGVKTKIVKKALVGRLRLATAALGRRCGVHSATKKHYVFECILMRLAAFCMPHRRQSSGERPIFSILHVFKHVLPLI
jgi:hypothetical protein